MNELLSERGRPASQPRRPQPEGIKFSKKQQHAYRNRTCKRHEQEVEMLSAKVIERVDVHLPVIRDVLIAICCVQINDPEVDHGAERKALADCLCKGLMLAVRGSPPYDGGPGDYESQNVLWVHIELSRRRSFSEWVKKRSHQDRQKMLPPVCAAVSPSTILDAVNCNHESVEWIEHVQVIAI
ncbi:hypothetical protein MPH_09199 [Macrophomina phaseolina MS6]|uniref:Uncharacterized protein n=1 Tax=Macrophomina phaseolina (strain MS6) TaxID=1126212 RepID=K2RGK4_MACPH|nr:hypothetical protein MPH_09199 [Macrophomina phaseolina MS6]